jgi:hypothetical protein
VPRRRFSKTRRGQGGVRAAREARHLGISTLAPRGSAGAGRPSRASRRRVATGAPYFWCVRPCALACAGSAGLCVNHQ